MLARLVALLLVAGCTQSAGTTLRIDLAYERAWSLDELEITVGDDRPETVNVASTVIVLLPDELADRELSVTIIGLSGPDRVAGGSTTVTTMREREVPVAMALDRLPCGAWCVAGSTRCVGDGVAICEERGECLGWSDPVPCSASAPSCSLGSCAATCIDECAAGESRCEGAGASAVCGQNDSDSCMDWMPATACRAGETCSAGACGSTCVDECVAGTKRCQGNGVATCGDLNLDSCFEWGPTMACTGGATCSGGECVVGCTDDCAMNVCIGDVKHTCGQYDADSCLDLSSGTTCPGSCSGGACIAGPCTTGCSRPSDTVSAAYKVTCGVRTNGTLACWGPAGAITTGIPSGAFKSVSTGNSTACGIRANDTLACWGSNGDGQATPPTGTFTAVSIATSTACGVRSDGTLACWGANPSNVLAVPTGTFTGVAVGASHACAIRSNGLVACWGSNAQGQAAPPGGQFASIRSNYITTCGVQTNGSLKCWGDNTEGRATPPSGVFASMDMNDVGCGVRDNGTLACWGGPGLLPPPAGSFRAVTVGANSNTSPHICGLASDGAVVCVNGVVATPTDKFLLP